MDLGSFPLMHLSSFPLTDEQRNKNQQDFIDSISHDAVCALASRHNHQKPCRVLHMSNGSFNVCFFVQFLDATRWVVRIPIAPAIHHVWAKLQSEVTTMQYIQKNTTIPIPTIHAYGCDSLLSNSQETLAYLILDHIPGRSLDFQTLANSPETHRMRFFSQLIDVLAGLRQLQFASAGSLFPDPRGGPVPVVGNLLSIPINELCVANAEMGSALPVPPLSPSASALDHALCQLRVLSEACRVPTSELDRETAEMEVFAANHLQTLVPELLASQDGSFILCHTDLRCSNIMVDDELNIQSVIDWEWAATTPRQLFMPPPWVTGLDLAYRLDEYDSRSASVEFHSVLREKAALSAAHRQLADEWGETHLELTSPLARILQHHSTLIRLYFRFIYRRFFSQPQHEVVPQFFQDEKNRTLAAEVQWRLDSSQRFTDHLKAEGLFVSDQRFQKMEEWLQKVRALEKKLGWDSE